MNKRLAILSTLLRYPDEALRADLPDMTAEIATAGFAERDRRALERFLDALRLARDGRRVIVVMRGDMHRARQARTRRYRIVAP